MGIKLATSRFWGYKVWDFKGVEVKKEMKNYFILIGKVGLLSLLFHLTSSVYKNTKITSSARNLFKSEDLRI